MANNEGGKKNIPLSTIPTSKLTVILNNFMINTVNHLNKLSVNVDEQLSEFDKKVSDLEIMTTLFETKLESLPDDIKSIYPPLEQCNLEDVNPVFSANININANANEGESNRNVNEEKKEEGQNEGENKENQQGDEDKKEENKEDNKEGEEGGENGELSPQEDLDKFLEQNPTFTPLFKMLKLGVPYIGVRQKAQLNGLDLDILDQLVEKAQKIYPNIQK